METLIGLYGAPNRSKEGFYFFDINKFQGAMAATWYALLYGVTGGLRPRLVVDVGTQAGRSALTMAAALMDHRVDGLVHTLDLPENRYHERAMESCRRAGLDSYVVFHRRGAPDELASVIQHYGDMIDLLYLDHAKERYAEDFLLVRDHVRFCVMHDVLIPGLDRIIQPQVTALIEKCPEFEFFVPRFEHLWAGVVMAQRRGAWPTYSS